MPSGATFGAFSPSSVVPPTETVRLSRGIPRGCLLRPERENACVAQIPLWSDFRSFSSTSMVPSDKRTPKLILPRKTITPWGPLFPLRGGPGEFMCSVGGMPAPAAGWELPIATTQCDRRRATIDSCAFTEALNPRFTRAACPHPPTLMGGVRPLDQLRL